MLNWISDTFDVTLLATISFIFLASLVGAYIRGSRRDPCLKSFVGFNVSLERTDHRIIWGKLELAATGLELRYKSTVQDVAHIESSYILYAEEFAEIQAIYRYTDQLSEADQRRREKDLRRSFHPGLIRRLVRSLRNFISIASDSLSEVVGVIIGGLRKPAGRYINDAGEAQLRSLGSSFIGYVGSSYDPLLERYIGQKMVVELVEDEEVHEHVGIFKHYSADFFEILDIQFPERQTVSIVQRTAQDKSAQPAQQIQVDCDGQTLRVINNSAHMVILETMTIGDQEEVLNVVVDAGKAVELHPEGDVTQAQLHFRVTRELDLIVPRSRCLVRHRAEFYRPELLPSVIFDLGVKLRGVSRLDGREEKLRERLALKPYDVAALANLGAILMQKNQNEEAEQLLRKAWQMRFSLHDNGRRTQLLLQELERRRSANPALRSDRTVSQTERSSAQPPTPTSRPVNQESFSGHNLPPQ